MFGINLREVALATLFVALMFGVVVGIPLVPQPYQDILVDVWYAVTLVVAAFLIVRWFIRRRRH
ncbi:MAG TPA: hypothetical protein VET25_05605 [Aestuariivirgaceae bacterium]|nr:hypothetical protein [Aestuariivirgaceae bacterium]